MGIKNFTLFKPAYILTIFAMVLSFLLLETLVYWKALDRLESLYTDAWHQMLGKRFSPQNVSLILVDESSLAQFSDTPLTFWTPYFAEVIKVLRDNGANAIGLDFLFSATAEQWLRRFDGMPSTVANYDQLLREQINKGKVVLVSPSTKLVNGKDGFVLPITDILFSVPDLANTQKYLGLSDLSSDNDSVFRRYYTIKPMDLDEDYAEYPPIKYNFAALLSLHARSFDAALRFNIEQEKKFRPIVFAGPPGTIPSISFARLLQTANTGKPLPQEMLDLINNRVVIIGSDYVGLNDVHSTPYGIEIFGNESKLMSGPEIQANIVESILSGRKIEEISLLMRWLIALLLLSLAAFGFRHLNNTIGMALLLLLCTVSLGIGHLFFRYYFLFPTVSIQVSLVFSFGFIYGLRFFGETRKRQHIENMFGRYVPEQVVSELIESGETPKLGGDSFDVTVLFSDIRNFTSLSEILKPEEVVEMINEYLSNAAPCIEKSGGTIDKFIGDAIMAEFGAPRQREDHALCGIRAALALKRTAEEFQTWFHIRFPQLSEFKFDIGVGLNSGPAIMGNIGSSQKTEYTALGDTVNIASRLEGVTKQLGWTIVVSEATINAAGGEKIIKVGRSESIQVKGLSKKVKVFEVLGIYDQPSPSL